MFHAMLRRKERADQETEFLFAQLTSVVANYSMAAPKTAISPAVFMPSEMLKKIEAKRRGPTKQERRAMDAQVRALFTALQKRQEEHSRNGSGSPTTAA
jgi:hypothetical protein